MISVGKDSPSLLRRPMAIYDFRSQGSATEITLLYVVVGKGTQQLSEIRPDSELSLLGPLGNGFSIPTGEEKLWAVAGGVGIAPFLLWARSIPVAARKNVELLFGLKDASQLSLLDDFQDLNFRLRTAVEGGGGDLRGTVVDLLEEKIRKTRPDLVLTCGPDPMMVEVVKQARKFGVPTEISLEARMGCGLGVCLSCVRSLADFGLDQRSQLVCQDGPIFRLPLG